MAELRVGAVGVEQGVCPIRLGQPGVCDRPGQPTVVGLAGQPSTRHVTSTGTQ
ncbi:hypothetical protein ACFV8E_35360 [Streptomyces sp. NPDC059849]|uniref:hypothetical protein n=1 Tax=Streptomyces sp. NPDC059849 TaxID=3346969 RepID=UPI003666464A